MRHASAIRAAFFDGTTYEELAARMSVPLGTMKSWNSSRTVETESLSRSMSTDDTIDPASGGNLIAAEYVLGVLGAEERREVERRLAQEPALASEVAFWEERLGGIADAVAPVAPPPRAWSQIEAAIAADAHPQAAASLWQSIAFWRSFAIGAATLAAASIAALAYIGLVPASRPPLMATLAAAAAANPISLPPSPRPATTWSWCQPRS